MLPLGTIIFCRIYPVVLLGKIILPKDKYHYLAEYYFNGFPDGVLFLEFHEGIKFHQIMPCLSIPLSYR